MTINFLQSPLWKPLRFLQLTFFRGNTTGWSASDTWQLTKAHRLKNPAYDMEWNLLAQGGKRCYSAQTYAAQTIFLFPSSLCTKCLLQEFEFTYQTLKVRRILNAIHSGEGVAQAVECMLSTHKVLGSITSMPPKISK